MAKANPCLVEALNTESIRAPMSLDRCHVDQQLTVDRPMTISIKNTTDTAHNPDSDDVHDPVSPVHHAGEESHAQKHCSPCLAEIPVMGGLIHAGAQFSAPGQGM